MTCGDYHVFRTFLGFLTGPFELFCYDDRQTCPSSFFDYIVILVILSGQERIVKGEDVIDPASELNVGVKG